MNRTYSAKIVRAITEKHGLSGDVTRLPSNGIVNDVWILGDEHVLRIPRRREYEPTLLAESVAVPCAIESGVRTPSIAVFDESRDIVPVAYIVSYLVPGCPLAHAQELESPEHLSTMANLIDEIVSQLVQLHRVTDVVDPKRRLNGWWFDDPLDSLRPCVDEGKLTIDGAMWIERLSRRLQSCFADGPKRPTSNQVLVHHDVHPWNVMVDSLKLSALIDWGNACMGDPAVDLSSFPLKYLPSLCRSYQAQAEETDEGFEGRVLWYWLGVAVSEPLSLDPQVFQRRWWRWPPGGLDEFRSVLFGFPEPWRALCDM